MELELARACSSVSVIAAFTQGLFVVLLLNIFGDLTFNLFHLFNFSNVLEFPLSKP